MNESNVGRPTSQVQALVSTRKRFDEVNEKIIEGQILSVVEYDYDTRVVEWEGEKINVPAVRSPSTATGYVQWEYLRKQSPSKVGRSIVKTRPGRGGTVKYVPWTNAAEMFDVVFGPGQYGQDIVQIMEHTKPDPEPKKYPQECPIPTDQQTITEFTVWTSFWATGLKKPIPVFGHGFYYNKDTSASRADAIEAALSRALTKAAARLSDYVRQVWAKDDESMAAMEGASRVQIQSVLMMVESIKETGTKNVKKMEKMLKDKGIGSLAGDGVEMNKLSKIEIEDLSKKLGELLMADDSEDKSE